MPHVKGLCQTAQPRELQKCPFPPTAYWLDYEGEAIHWYANNYAYVASSYY